MLVMDEMKQNILSKLNEEQKLPVVDYLGPQFLVAGPGSGKTHTLVARTQYMLLDGINPSNILLFTFTNKAAKEIKERISNAVGAEAAALITTGTYHSFCCRLLRQYGEHLGYKKGFSIFDMDTSKTQAPALLPVAFTTSPWRACRAGSTSSTSGSRRRRLKRSARHCCRSSQRPESTRASR